MSELGGAAVAGLVVSFLVVAIAFLWIGYRTGQRDMREEIEQNAREAENAREEIDRDVQSRPDDQLDRDHSKWLRD